MIIKCRHCGKEFDKASHRNQHEKDAYKGSGVSSIRVSARAAITKHTQRKEQ